MRTSRKRRLEYKILAKLLFVSLIFTTNFALCQSSGPFGAPVPQGFYVFDSIYTGDGAVGGGGAATVFNGVLYSLWMQQEYQLGTGLSIGQLTVQTTSTGSQNFGPTNSNFGLQGPHVCTSCPNGDSQAQVTVWNGQVYGAYRKVDTQQLVLVHNIASDGNVETADTISSITIGRSPAIANFNGVLYLAFQKSDSSNTLVIARSTDGIHFALQQYPQFALGAPPAMVSYSSKCCGTQLVIAYRSNSDSRYLQVLNSSDGSNFTLYQVNAIQMNSLSPPALAPCFSANVSFLCFSYIKINTNDVYESGTGDGHSFTTPAYQSALGQSNGGPMLAEFDGYIYAFYQSTHASGGGTAQVSVYKTIHLPIP